MGMDMDGYSPFFWRAGGIFLLFPTFRGLGSDQCL
jgi:hypothetical protein